MEAFQINITVDKDSTLEALSAVKDELNRVIKYGFTESELKRTKKIFLKSAELAAQEMDKQYNAGIAGKCLNAFLKNQPILPPDFLKLFLKTFQDSIQLTDINDCFAALIKNDNQIAIVTGMDKPGYELPLEKNLADLLQNKKEKDLQPYQDILTDSVLMQRPSLAHCITKTQTDTAAGITVYTLFNGIKVILKPTRFQNTKILMDASCSGGSSCYPSDYKLSVRFAASIAKESGVAHFSKENLRKLLAGKSVSVDPYISDLTSGMSGSCSTEDLEYMMQLIYLYFTAPRWDDTAYTSLVKRNESLYNNILLNPENYLNNQVQRIRYFNNPDAPGVYPNPNDWKLIQLDKVKRVYRENFSNANGFTFIFTGAFHVEQIKPFIEAYLENSPILPIKEVFGIKTGRCCQVLKM